MTPVHNRASTDPFRLSSSHPFSPSTSASRNPRPLHDSLHSHIRDEPLLSPEPQRSSCQIISDFIECIKYFVISQITRLIRCLKYWFVKEPLSSEPSPSTPLREHNLLLLENGDPSSSTTYSTQTEEQMLKIEEEDIVFRALPITSLHREGIDFIMDTLANKSALAIPITQLRQIGDSLKDLHTLRFLEYILNEPTNATNFKNIKNNCFGIIWSQFVDETAEKLQEMDKQNLIEPYLDAFVRSIRTNIFLVREQIAKNSWTGLLHYLATATYDTPSSSSRSGSNSIESDDSISASPHLESDQSLKRSLDPNHSAKKASYTQSPTSHYILDPMEGIPISQRCSEADPMQLTITEEQKTKLNGILRGIATHTDIVFMTSRIMPSYDLASLAGVHPLRLLLEIFQDTTNYANFSIIMNTSNRKMYLLKHLCRTLKFRSSPENLIPFISKFARLLSLNEEDIRTPIIAGGTKNWENVIRYIYSCRKMLTSSSGNT
ncbi:MAG: hypothetical protein EBZ47_03520 [Chlamydiae bacterium]|nr:hypothetical protein [Chlamydiota bacterium]